MNKFVKVIIATLGGVNLAFSIVIPIFVAFLIVDTTNLSKFNEYLIYSIGYLSALYRGLKIWIK